jgi:formyltetrahydrofolate hydrolase
VSPVSPGDTTAVLLLSCADQPGMVAAVADFVYRHGGNIVDAQQHTDRTDGVFFQRIEFRVVLARYMQILSAGFVDRWPNAIVNIHHSFPHATPSPSLER